MATAASHWEPDQKELAHLEGLGSEQAAVLAIGYLDGIEPWQIGKRAGYSGGLNDDEQKKRSNWSAAASRGAKKKGKVLPEIRGLQEQLERYRKDGGEPFSVSWQQKKARLAYWVMHGAANESIRATVEHNKMAGKGDSVSSRLGQVISQMIADVGLERVRRGFEELGYGSLKHKYPDLLLEQKTLEDGDEQSGPAARRAGDDPRNLDSGGSRRVGDDAARKMDQGSGIAGGAGAGQRSVGGGAIEGQLSELEKLELKKLQEARP